MSRTQSGNVRSLSEYFNASQLRLDTWHRLKHQSALLAERTQEGLKHSRLLENVHAALRDLAPIETYWAFPSEERFYGLQRSLERGEYESLARRIAFIVRALTSASFRRRVRTTNDVDFDKENAESESELWALASEVKRPYFEVLVVDQISIDSRHSLREGLLDKQRPDDPFAYDILVVPSFEDALIAAVLNPHIQAAILGPDFRLRPPQRALHC